MAGLRARGCVESWFHSVAGLRARGCANYNCILDLFL
jgi:hypothetical protein